MKRTKFIISMVMMLGICGVSNGSKIPEDVVTYESMGLYNHQQNLEAREQIRALASSALNDYQEFLKYIRKVYAGSNTGLENVFPTNRGFRRALAEEFFNQVNGLYINATNEDQKSLANVSWVVYFALRCGDACFADENYKEKCEQLSKASGSSERDHLVYTYKVLEQIPSEESFIFSSFKGFLKNVYNIEVTKRK